MTHALGLLAGGRSSRFGGDKAYARSDERWPLRELVDRLRPGAAEAFVAGGDPALAAELGLVPLADPLPDAGPLAGIQAVLAAASSEFVFIFPCDMPRLPAAAPELFAAHLGAHPVILLRRGGIPVPVCGLYRRSLAGPLAAALASGQRKINGALEKTAVAYLDAETLAAKHFNPDDFLGFNTPVEFAVLFPSAG